MTPRIVRGRDQADAGHQSLSSLSSHLLCPVFLFSLLSRVGFWRARVADGGHGGTSPGARQIQAGVVDSTKSWRSGWGQGSVTWSGVSDMVGHPWHGQLNSGAMMTWVTRVWLTFPPWLSVFDGAEFKVAGVVGKLKFAEAFRVTPEVIECVKTAQKNPASTRRLLYRCFLATL